MFGEEEEEEIEEEQKYTSEDDYGERMDVSVTRTSKNEVSPTISDSDTDNLAEMGESFEKSEMSDEEMKLQEELARLESEAMERKKRNQQKQKLRDLKKEVRKAKFQGTVAPVKDKLDPLVTSGKKAVDMFQAWGERSKERQERVFGGDGVAFEENPPEQIPPAGNTGMRRLGDGLDLQRKSSLGTVGRKEIGVSVSEGKGAMERQRGSGIAGTMQRREPALSFNAKKTGGLFDMGGKKERLVDWGARTDSGIGFSNNKSKTNKSKKKNGLDLEMVLRRK